MRTALALMAALLAATLAQAQAPARAPEKEAPAPADLTVDTVAKWTADYIDDSGYGLAYADPAAAYYVHMDPQEAAATTVRISLRREMFAPTTGGGGFRYRSARSVADIDCSMPRMRLLAADLFQWSNLQGERSSSEGQQPQWQYPRERTAGEAVVNFACKMRQLARSQAAAP